MTTKQRACLKGLAMTMEPILQIGKSSLTPELTAAVDEALEARELIKISVLKNCFDDSRQLAQISPAARGGAIVSNEEVCSLTALRPDLFFFFSS